MLAKTEPLLWHWVWSHYPAAGAGLVAVSFVPVAVMLCVVAWWHRQAWQKHPLSKCLKLFVETPDHPDAWMAAAMEINVQYRRYLGKVEALSHF